MEHDDSFRRVDRKDLYILGRGRERVQDFPIGTRLSARKPSFWREKRHTVVIYYEGLQKCCRIKTGQEHGSSFGIFGTAKRLKTKKKRTLSRFRPII